MEKGKITEEEALEHPKRHVLTRAVGVDRDVVVDSGMFQVQPKDRILLCSDGLTSFVSKEDLHRVLDDYTLSEREIINDLFTQVYENGAKDNVTAVLKTIE